MRKLIFFLILVTLVSGCAYGKEKAKKLIIDSDYAKYEKLESELEKSYINGEISYAEYQEKLEELKQDRLRSEKNREDILSKE